ncbi:GlxA family transcriptional regulator [Chitinophaga japonensis]|uniref:Transcriptional regulator GlxA family with amidase domain n=1 Tax=Chitinophaga japonensis TaxID=104662 RepID=A0A562TC00_CHIJA|nr:GlxA family transcriptional regulator [Chitinophaga japonensis]TWI90913.1 transcriptional regulator GlxA family with amidase domain [Chitinophaga japonensis]
MKHVVILIPPQTSILDVAGPLEVLSKANDCMVSANKQNRPYYITHLVSMDNTSIVPTSCGMPVICEGGLSGIFYSIDTVIIAGRGIYKQHIPQSILDWLRSVAKEHPKTRIASVCAGAFILAETGLLNGRKATTHWMLCDQMALQFPRITVERDPIFIKDGNFYTSAGISTGIDLTLGLVEEDVGRDVAMEVARILVLYLKRPGNQSQFSTLLITQSTNHLPVNQIVQFIQEHLSEDLSVERLADRLSMSSRNFSRVFTKETGISPAKYVEKVRVEAARRYLEESNLSLDQVAQTCGLVNANGLRRLFMRHLNTSPGIYRKNFGPKLQSAEI